MSQIIASEDTRNVPVAPVRQKPVSSITRQDMIEEYEDVFEPRDDHMKGETFKIVLEDNDEPVKMTTPRFVAKKHKEPLKRQLDELLAEGKIIGVTGPSSDATVLCCRKKKNNDVRITVGFRPLNKYDKREGYNSPSVLDACQEIKAGEAAVFSTYDGHKGYNQCALHEQSKDFTAFICPERKFRWNVAPMGILAISGHYNSRMSEALDGVDNFVKIVDVNLTHS